MDGWIAEMFGVAIGGAFVGLLYPSLVKLFRESAPPLIYVSAALSPGKRWAVYLGVGLVLSAILAALGFVTFLGDEENRQSLKDSGVVAYFAAFTYGFGAASLVEEPLKKT